MSRRTVNTIVPAYGQLFCRPFEPETQTASGILLPEKTAEKPKIAQIINIGEGVSGYEADDQIIYKSYSATEIKLNGDDYMVVHVDDVLGKVIQVKE